MPQIAIADVLIIRGERILLVQQKKPSAYGQWGLPGGHVEPGESPREAIRREVHEELGVSLADASIRGSTVHAERGTSEGDMQVTTFVADWPHENPVIQEEELIGFGWFTIDDMKALSGKLRSPWILRLAKKFAVPAPRPQ